MNEIEIEMKLYEKKEKKIVIEKMNYCEPRLAPPVRCFVQSGRGR